MSGNRTGDVTREAICHALAEGGLSLEVDGIHDCDDPAECLYQLCSPRLQVGSTILPASELVPLLEREGVTAMLDRVLLSAVLERLRRAPDARLGCALSAASFLYLQDWMALQDLLGNSAPQLSRLVIELAETLPLLALSTVARRMATLRSLGIRLAIDNFGATHGPAAMASLNGFDIVKIDPIHLRSIHIGGGSTSLQRIVIAARQVAPVVVIGGIGTEDQLDLARHAGASHAQGALFSDRTVPALPLPRLALGQWSATESKRVSP